MLLALIAEGNFSESTVDIDIGYKYGKLGKASKRL